MKRIILAFFAVCFWLHITAQNKIKGCVSDENSQPLFGTSIFLPELNKGTTTNEKGEFVLENLPDGKLKIQVSFIGYNSQIITINLPAMDSMLDIKLVQAIIKSQEVVVSGGYVSSQHDNAVKIDVLKSKEISISGTPNYMETLTTVPGVDMISKGQGVSKPVIRGLSMNDILVLNNGVRIENYQFSENHPLGIDGNNIERIEIIKGPASLLYGSDAIGGVLNFIKENPAPGGKIIGDFKTRFHSNTLGFDSNLGIKGASKNVFYGIRTGIKKHADYIQGGGNYVPNTRFNEMTINANMGYTGKKGVFKLYYDYFEQDLGMSVPAVLSIITERGRKNEVWFQDLTHQLLSSQNTLYLGKFKWINNVAYQNALRKLQTNLDVPFVEMNLNTITYESKLHLPSDEHSEYVIGIQGMTQANRNLNDRASQFLPDADIQNLGFLGLLQYTVWSKLKLQGGIRYDINNTRTYALGTTGTSDYHAPVNKNFPSLNGSVGAIFNLNEKFMFRTNFAKAYRSPNLSELTSNGMHGNRFEKGNENLNPQEAYETDVSMHYHGKLLSFDIAGFYNYINDYIFISPTQDTTQTGVDIYRFSQTNAYLNGGEAGIHFHPKAAHWLHVEGNYSMTIGKQENGDFLPFIPAHKLRYEIRAECKKIGFLKKSSVKVSGLTALKQNNPSVFETETVGYTLINLHLISEILISGQRVVFGISANNLLDKAYFDHLSTLKTMNYFNQGRNISVFVNIPFELK